MILMGGIILIAMVSFAVTGFLQGRRGNGFFNQQFIMLTVLFSTLSATVARLFLKAAAEIGTDTDLLPDEMAADMSVSEMADSAGFIILIVLMFYVFPYVIGRMLAEKGGRNGKRRRGSNSRV